MKDSELIEIVKGVLEKIVVSIVDKPELVQVVHSAGDQIIVFSIRCDKSDRGKVIGREGRMAVSLRNIINALSAKYKFKCLLEIEK